MKKTFLLLILLLCLSMGLCESDAAFVLPSGILIVEEGAFEGTAIRGSVYVPPETRYVAPSAFDSSVTLVYGYLGTAGEQYASDADKEFIVLDIMDIEIDSSALWIPQGASVTLTARAESFAPCEFAFTVEVGGAVCESGYSASPSRTFTLDRAGEASVTVKARSRYDEAETVKSGFIHVEPSIAFSSAQIYLEPGDTVKLLSDDETREVSFSCSSPIIQIDGGFVTGLTAGSCKVSAEAALPGGIVSNTVGVTVCAPITNVNLSGLPKGLYEGESARCRLTYYPSDARFNEFVFASSDESVLTVDENGLVTAVSAGSASVTATAYSGKSASVTVEVWAPVSEIIPPEKFIADTDVLTAIPCEVLPENAHDKTLTYTVSDPKTAVISGGKIKGLKPGEVTVTAAAVNGVSVSFPVTINRPVTNVKLPAKVKIDLFDSVQLDYNVYPADAGDPSLVWSSSDESVAVVDENGIVYGAGNGTAVIRAESVNGKYAVSTVTVVETLPTAFTFEELYVTMKVGERHSVSALFTPEKAQNRELTYQSSDPSIVSVDGFGMLTAHREGTACITAVSGAVASVKDTLKVCVIADGALPLSGIVIGINPGHEIKPILTQLPMAPGSSMLKNAVGVGGKGAYTGVPEYETNLQVSLKLASLLREQGATVVMTRTENDVLLNNIKRAEMLNEAGVDLAIQVHCNDSASSAPNGLSTYYRSNGSYVDESRLFAVLAGEHLSEITGAANNGALVCNTYMSLNYSTTPTILVEMGFMSNKTEDYLLVDDTYRGKLAQGMLEAIADYFGREL